MKPDQISTPTDTLPRTPRRVLIVEDEPELARLIERQVLQAGYDVQSVATGEGAIRVADARPFDLVLLDLMLPGIDGLETCRRLRAREHYMPIMMLTARSTEVDKVLGLEMGADDYLTKPFGIQELLARIKAIFRRVDALAAHLESVGRRLTVGDGLQIDACEREASVRGQRLALTHKEFDLLMYFAQNPGRVYTRAQLLDAVWGYSHEGYEHAINCHINRIRAKIERDPSHPTLLLTVWGVGYKFTTDVAEQR